MDYDEKDEELFEMIEGSLHGMIESDEREQLISLISEVFERLPSEDREIIMHKRGVRFAAPIFNCTAEQLFVDPTMLVKDERYEPLLYFWLVCLSGNFLEMPKEEALYTIAHELAHVYLEHQKFCKMGKVLEKEIEADKQVIKWNFESELRQTPTNYIYGEGKIGLAGY